MIGSVERELGDAFQSGRRMRGRVDLFELADRHVRVDLRGNHRCCTSGLKPPFIQMSHFAVEFAK